MSSENARECRIDLPAGDVDAALAAAPDIAREAPTFREDAAGRLGLLRALGAYDLTTARALEPHLDAVEILAEAGLTPADVDAAPGDTWGVYASRAPELRAERRDDGWVLTGVKPWCSLADRLDRALVTCGTDEGQRMFALALQGDDGSVVAVDEPWVSRGLAAIPSGSVRFDRAVARPVGEPGFYLGRPGFAWGGIGVAAIWAGGVDALARTVRDAATRREPDQIALWHVGRLDVITHVLDVVLDDAARAIASGEAIGADGARLASRVRAIVADLGEQALQITAHALGPGPLTADETHARRVADLEIYLRQHHGERELAALGREALA